jgi:hypothetical protein
MRELMNQQSVRRAELGVSAERGPNYRTVIDETLPPLHELIAEYNAMVQERRQQQRADEHHFHNTMYEWRKRERGEA